jgi:hypothetical protein
MFEDEEDIPEYEESEEYKNDMRRMAIEEFTQGCYEAYDVLVSKGKKALQEAELSSIQMAINRMTALFIINEEFERCSFLKKFVQENMPGFEIKPDHSIEKELNLI